MTLVRSHPRLRASISKARGFTLMELMVVVIIIAILAALAVPSMIRARDDRRVYDDAASIMRLIRSARLRAIGRGTAVAVQMTNNGATDRGTFRTYEAVTINPTTTGGAPTASANDRTPMSSCVFPNWTAAPPAGNAVPVDGMNLNGPLETTIDIQSTLNFRSITAAGAGANGAANVAWLCFTPGGRTYVSTATAVPAFNGAISLIDLDITVTRSVGGLKRHVLVPPSGIARIYSK